MKLRNALVLNKLKSLALVVSNDKLPLKQRYQALQVMRKIETKLRGVA
jgi:hypothetical protein